MAVLAELVDAADVPMADLARELDLGAEAARHVAGARDLGAQDLEGHDLVELAVVRLVDHAHAALAERLEDLVAAGEERAFGDDEQALPALEAGLRRLLVLRLAGATDEDVRVGGQG